MGWNNFNSEGGQEKYLQIKSGEVVQIHILSKEPIPVLNHWINKKKHECEGTACEWCAQANKPKKGWVVQVLERKSGTTKEFEFGPSIASQIENIAEILRENDQTIHDIDLRIKREGSGPLDTEYFVNQVPLKSVSKKTVEPNETEPAEEAPF